MKKIIYGHFVFTEIGDKNDPYPELTIEMIKYAKSLLEELDKEDSSCQMKSK